MVDRNRAGGDLDEYLRNEYRAERGAYAEPRPAYEQPAGRERVSRYWSPRLPLSYRAIGRYPRSGTGAPLNNAADRFYTPDDRAAWAGERYSHPPDAFTREQRERTAPPRVVHSRDVRERHERYGRERHEGPGLLDAAEDFYRELRGALGPEPGPVHRPSSGPYRGRGPRSYKRSDERIREDVSERLTMDPLVDATDIEVHVTDREVTLSGTVADRSEKRRAEDLADEVSGVTHVQNNLRVRQPVSESSRR